MVGRRVHDGLLSLYGLNALPDVRPDQRWLAVLLAGFSPALPGDSPLFTDQFDHKSCHSRDNAGMRAKIEMIMF